MTEYYTMVLDNARARYFILDDSAKSALEGGPTLIETEDLINPEAAMSDSELYSNLRGRNRAVRGGPEHNYDDHRDSHSAESARRFAKHALMAGLRFVSERSGSTLIIVAGSDMMGHTRPILAKQLHDGLDITLLNKDLGRHTPREVQETLAKEGLLPKRRAPDYTRNGRMR